MAPWLIGLLQRRQEFYSLVSEHHTASGLSLALVAVILGMFLEDLGSRFESRHFDKLLDSATGGKHSENWQKYLRTAFKLEPVGARYIRNILLRMKFELGMALALVLVAFGVFSTTLDLWISGVLAISACALACLLYDEARTSHRVLSTTRELLLQGLLILGDSPVEGK